MTPLPPPIMPPMLPSPPPMPGMLPPPPIDNTAAEIQAGKDAFDSLAGRHTVFRTTILQIPRDAVTLPLWYQGERVTLASLRDLTKEISIARVSGLCDFLRSIDATRSYSVSEMIMLVRKFLLRENVSFPEVELPARIHTFLKKTLREPGAREIELTSLIETTMGSLITQTEVLLSAKSDVEAAKARTYVSSFAADLALAEDLADQAGRDLAAKQALYDSYSSELESYSSAEINDDQIFRYLMQVEPDAELSAKYASALQAEHDATEFLKPFQALLEPILTERSLYVDGLSAARTAELQLKSTDPFSPDLPGLTSQRLAYQTRLAGADSRLNAVLADRSAFMQDHPELYQNNNPVTANSLITKFLYDHLSSSPESLSTIINDVMKRRSLIVDAKAASLESREAAMITAKQEVFKNYINAKANAELAFYSDQMNVSRAGYERAIAQLQARSDELQALNATLPTNIERLGGVIGFACYSLNIGKEQMGAPWFIRMMLQQVGAASGKWDSHTFQVSLGPTTINQYEQFWKESGRSQDLANGTLGLMDTLQAKTEDFEYGEGKRLRDEIVKMSDWLKQLQIAYQSTYDRMNTREYVKEAMREFRLLPENQIIDERHAAIARELTRLTAKLSGEQELLSDLLDAIEEVHLEAEEVVMPDIEFMTFEEKRNLWHGVRIYLEQQGPNWKIADAKMKNLIADLRSGTVIPNSNSFLVLYRMSARNMTAATHMQRRLLKDSNFIMTLRKYVEAENLATYNTVRATT